MNQRIRVTKIFTFECAHALQGYDGACSNIHGHTYRLRVSVIGEPRKSNDHPKSGMVVDFGEIKKLVYKEVIDKWDHALLLRKDSSFASELLLSNTNIVLTPYQPTCENLLIEIKDRLKPKFDGSNLELIALRLDETSSAYAEWHLNDQRHDIDHN